MSGSNKINENTVRAFADADIDVSEAFKIPMTQSEKVGKTEVGKLLRYTAKNFGQLHMVLDGDVLLAYCTRQETATLICDALNAALSRQEKSE